MLKEQGTSKIPEIGERVSLGDMVINYHDIGQGPPVLLVHGSGPGATAWANWRLTIPALKDQFRVIAPDMAGFGYTDTKDPVNFSMDVWDGQLTALIDHLGVDKVVIVGNSFGGSVALEFALRHPERCTALVLMGPVGLSFPLTEGLDAVWGYRPSLEAMAGLLNVFVADNSFISDDLVEMRYQASIRADVQDRFSSLFPAPRQRWVDALAHSEGDVRGITQETLIVHGLQDKVIPYAASERLASVMPNAELVSIDQCGHWVQIEQTEKFNNLLLRFLSIQESGQGS